MAEANRRAQDKLKPNKAEKITPVAAEKPKQPTTEPVKLDQKPQAEIKKPLMTVSDVELARQRVLAEFEQELENAEAQITTGAVNRTAQRAPVKPTPTETEAINGVAAAENSAPEVPEKPPQIDQPTELEAIDSATPEAGNLLMTDAEARPVDLQGDFIEEVELQTGEQLTEFSSEDTGEADTIMQLHDTSTIGTGESFDLPATETVQTLGDSIREHLAEYLEPLEEEVEEIVTSVATAVVQTAREVRVLYGAGEVKAVEVEDKLEDLCAQLFENLGIEYGEETIKTFLNAIKTDVTQEREEPVQDEFIESGTHESKFDAIPMLGRLVHIIRQEAYPQSMLGRLALRFERLVVSSEEAA